MTDSKSMKEEEEKIEKKVINHFIPIRITVSMMHSMILSSFSFLKSSIHSRDIFRIYLFFLFFFSIEALSCQLSELSHLSPSY